MQTLFWVLFAFIVYVYGGYFLLVAAGAYLRFDRRPQWSSDAVPSVTIIVSAFNEQSAIARKLENILALDYPANRLEIMVGSDASTDATDDIVRSFHPRGVVLERVEGRVGKTAVQNHCAEIATGEVIVFTDATTYLYKDSLRELVRPFADPKVGCIGAQLRYVSECGDSIGRGSRSYWSYEVLLKKFESRFNSLVNVSGAYYAIRKDVYSEIDSTLTSDFVVVLDTYVKGLKSAYAVKALCEEGTLVKSNDEFRMRVRVALRSYHALWNRAKLLNPLTYPVFAFQLLSHKVLRYGVGLMLPAIFIANVTLLQSSLYQASLSLQLVLYLCASVVWWREKVGKSSGIFVIPYYFVLTNVAALVAFLKFLMGKRIVTWAPIR